MAHRDETTKCYLRQERAFTQYGSLYANNYSIHGIYKPTNITGGHHIVEWDQLHIYQLLLSGFRTLCGTHVSSSDVTYFTSFFTNFTASNKWIASIRAKKERRIGNSTWELRAATQESNARCGAQRWFMLVWKCEKQPEKAEPKVYVAYTVHVCVCHKHTLTVSATVVACWAMYCFKYRYPFHETLTMVNNGW